MQIEIKYSKKAGKTLKSMDIPLKERIEKGINALPKGDVKRLQGYTSTFRLRVGDFRVLFSMEYDIIMVKAILPRGQAYK